MTALPRAAGAACTACVMDAAVPDIRFDTAGKCSYCHDAEAALARVRLSGDESQAQLSRLAADIRKRSVGHRYDAVLGLSGGVDSSYTAWLAHQLGMRVLAVHFDNGWNTEIAASNIRAVVDACGFDLETYVIDWPEFRDLQRAFIRAGVIDIEMLSDHAIMAATFDVAGRYGIRYILSGTNVATEHGMPRAWVWNKQDLTNIRAIHARFGERPLRSFPRMGLLRSAIRRHFGLGFKFVEVLNLANYRKDHAIGTLSTTVGWRNYGGKHYESVFTKFYQAYILPRKFGIDKRRVHLSALIRNGEITRAAAIEELHRPPYEVDELRRDKTYVLKKLGFSDAEFEEIMKKPPVPHDHYRSDRPIRQLLRSVVGRGN